MYVGKLNPKNNTTKPKIINVNTACTNACEKSGKIQPVSLNLPSMYFVCSGKSAKNVSVEIAPTMSK